MQDDKTVSLSENQRLKETEDLYAFEKAWSKERLAHKDPAVNTYAISLKQAELPGLPTPVQKTNALAMKSPQNGTALMGTNSASLSAPPAKDGLPLAEEADEDKAPPVDADLEEAEQIMLDYVSLIPAGSPLLATHSEAHH